MNGNTPYTGRPDVAPAGQQSADALSTLSAEEKRMLKRDLTRIAERTRRYLPEEFIIGSELNIGLSGPQGIVAVQPPFGYPVSMDVSPDLDAVDRFVSEEDCAELASGLAARAVYQVMSTIQDDVTPMAQ